MRTHQLLLSAIFCLLACGCSQRPVGLANENAGPDAGSSSSCQDLWDCNPGVECGELVLCQDGQCRPDLGHVIIPCTVGECADDNDCVVAVPADCCWGCPEVVTRAELATRECFFEQGQAPDPLPEECLMDCGLCFDCVEQPLGARCDQGQCVATDLGCPTFSPDPVPSVTTLELVQNGAALEGQVRRLIGTTIPGPGICDQGPDPWGCDHAAMLNGTVRLQGWLCDLPLFFLGSTCGDQFQGSAFEAGGWYELEGVVHGPPNPWEPPWVDVTGFRIVDPLDLGGRFDVTVTEIESEANLPVCVPPEIHVNDTGSIYLALSGEQVRAVAPLFSCWGPLSGGFDDETRIPFTVWPPIDCDGWCEYSLSAAVTGDQVAGHYESFDGDCRHLFRFQGSRVSGE